MAVDTAGTALRRGQRRVNGPGRLALAAVLLKYLALARRVHLNQHRRGCRDEQMLLSLIYSQCPGRGGHLSAADGGRTDRVAGGAEQPVAGRISMADDCARAGGQGGGGAPPECRAREPFRLAGGMRAVGMCGPVGGLDGAGRAGRSVRHQRPGSCRASVGRQADAGLSLAADRNRADRVPLPRTGRARQPGTVRTTR